MVKRLKYIERKEAFTIQIDGESVTAFPGETVATALLATGKKIMRRTLKNKRARSYFCGMGICNECLVRLEDGTRVRACQTLAYPSMKIHTEE
jgi:aerobic-type carbon monoxide dehydrogenase small subunit (CoxS/CutS family)